MQEQVKSIGQYQLGDCIGRGAFGTVNRCLNMETGEVVAIKSIGLANIPKAEVNALMMEIDLLKKLNHPNIVKYLGFIKAHDQLYIILEYCENGSLQTTMKKFGSMTETLLSVYIYQILQGLIYLHEEGVIHRDLKGANILTTKEGHVKLGDFGVATNQSEANDDNQVVGSPYWMAPEVVEMSGAVTTASDIWSLGCLIIELIQGVPPYFNLPPMAALFKIVQDDHPPFPEHASPALSDFLMQCFQKDPNLRTTAKKLTKHQWLQSARAKLGVNAQPTFPQAIVKSSSTKTRTRQSEDGFSSESDGEPVRIEQYIEGQADFDDDFDIDDDMENISVQPATQHVAESLDSVAMESDQDDPFSAFDQEGSDFEQLVQTKDSRARISTDIMESIGYLTLEQKDDILMLHLNKLVAIFKANSDSVADLIKYRGIVPVLSLIEDKQSPAILRALLEMIIIASSSSIELLENLCLLGVVPRVLQLCETTADFDIKFKCCKFIQMLFSTNDTTRRVFVSCRGINILIFLLASSYQKESDVIWIAVEGVFTILNFQGSTRNDFCRLLLHQDGIVHLVAIMHQLSFDRRPDADKLLVKVLETLNTLSRSDSFVKERMSTKAIIRALMYEYSHFSAVNQLILLKCVKNLSVIPDALQSLQEVNVVIFFVKILALPEGQFTKDLRSQALYILFNFCRVNKSRLEDAAQAGVIPQLQNLIDTNHPLKQLALPILCDMAHASKATREILWHAGAFQSYINLLEDNNAYWQNSALESLTTWLVEDQALIEPALANSGTIMKVINAFVSSKSSSLATITAPILKLVTVSTTICRQVAKATFVTKLLERLAHPDVVVKLNLLKILLAVLKHHSNPRLFGSTYSISEAMAQLSTGPVLVREMAKSVQDVVN